MQVQAFELQERLKYCSPLGGALIRIRNLFRNAEGPVTGLGTIKKLEAAGISSLMQLQALSSGDLQRLGIRKDFAKQIAAYLRRRAN